MDQAYYLQHPQQSQQPNSSGNQDPATYPSTGMAGYPQGHQMSHIPYHQNPHAPYPNHMPNTIDYSVHSTTAPPPGSYHPSAPSHYPGQLHHGYQHPSDPYMQPPYQQPYDYDPNVGQIGGLYYGAPNTVPLSSDPSSQVGTNGAPGLQGSAPYGQYPGQLPPPQHYQQNLGLDPNSQQPGYGYNHPHHQAHHHPSQNFGQNPGQPLDQNYMAFGQQGQYHGPPGTGYIPFNSAVQPLPNGQIHHHNPYGIIQNPNQIGIIDSSIQNRPPQSSIGKASIKNEEQTMENELHLVNSLGDSQSQQEDKLKQGGSNYLIPGPYDQQPYNYYLGNQQYLPKKDDLMGQNQFYQGYSQYPTGQYPPGSAQSIPSMQNPASQTSIKDKDDPSKRQPNSPGRRKTIKKGSPTGNTEPSSPASPRGRKRKNTGKLEQTQQQSQPESSSTLNPGLVTQQQQQQQQQFGLHLVKVPNQDQKQMGYPGQPYYQQMNPMGKVVMDPNTQHISGIDSTSLQRLKELPTDFNMNEFTAVYDDQKQIGSITKEERKQKIKNYQDKRKRRSWQKKISYDVRKKVADGRLRVKGRFVTKKQAMEMLSIVGKEEDYTMDQLKDLLKQQGIQANGGEEDSKSPTLPKKKNQSQPGTIASILPGEDDEDDGGSGGEVHSEELPPSELPPIVRGKSCENIGVPKDNYFQGQDSYYPSMMQGNIGSNESNNNSHNMNDNQLRLKLEQKDNEIKNMQINKQNSQQFQQLQNQQSYSSQSQSQSPVRSPKKQNQNTSGLQSSNTVKFMESNQPHLIQNMNIEQNQNNTNGHTSYGELQQNGESPQHSTSNILNQEITDQFGNLNIKSPDQKQKIIQQKNNPQLLNLNQTEQQQQFFGNQPGQNYNLYTQQYNNGNNTGYPIHQQQ